MWKFKFNQTINSRKPDETVHLNQSNRSPSLHFSIILFVTFFFSSTCDGQLQLGLNDQLIHHQDRLMINQEKILNDEENLISSSRSELQLLEDQNSYSTQSSTIHKLLQKPDSNSQLQSTSIIFHDDQEEDQDLSSNQIQSQEPDQPPPDSSPLRSFFSNHNQPSQSTHELVLEPSIQHAEQEHKRANLQARDNLIAPAPSYPGTDTVYATKTVIVNPGQPQFTPNPNPNPNAPPTVVVILQGNLSNPPQPSPLVNTITLDKNPHPGPHTTTIYPPGIAMATVTVMSSAKTNLDHLPSYQSICLTLIFSFMGFIIGGLHFF